MSINCGPTVYCVRSERDKRAKKIDPSERRENKLNGRIGNPMGAEAEEFGFFFFFCTFGTHLVQFPQDSLIIHKRDNI